MKSEVMDIFHFGNYWDKNEEIKQKIKEHRKITDVSDNDVIEAFIYNCKFNKKGQACNFLNSLLFYYDHNLVSNFDKEILLLLQECKRQFYPSKELGTDTEISDVVAKTEKKVAAVNFHEIPYGKFSQLKSHLIKLNSNAYRDVIIMEIEKFEEYDKTKEYDETYDLYFGKQIKKYVKNPVCEVSKEPLEDDDEVLVVSMLPPFVEYKRGSRKLDELHVGQQKLKYLSEETVRSYDKRVLKNRRQYQYENFCRRHIPSIIATTWEFQTFVKLKYIKPDSKEILLQRSVPIGYTDFLTTAGRKEGYIFIIYEEYKKEISIKVRYKEYMVKTLGEKLRVMREKVAKTAKNNCDEGKTFPPLVEQYYFRK